MANLIPFYLMQDILVAIDVRFDLSASLLSHLRLKREDIQHGYGHGRYLQYLSKYERFLHCKPRQSSHDTVPEYRLITHDNETSLLKQYGPNDLRNENFCDNPYRKVMEFIEAKVAAISCWGSTKN